MPVATFFSPRGESLAAQPASKTSPATVWGGGVRPRNKAGRDRRDRQYKHKRRTSSQYKGNL